MTAVRHRVATEHALVRAREFLGMAQRETGEIPADIVLRHAEHAPAVARPDATVFVTAYAMHALQADESPEGQRIRARAVAFILRHREWPGVWRFRGRGAPLPLDLDTTSVARLVLRAAGVPGHDVPWLFRVNRDGTGRFRTWITPGNIRTLHPLYWLRMLGELTPSRAYGVWKRGVAHRRDRDVVVNAHVVALLGDEARTAGAIDWILETVRAGEEEQRDRWYHDREVLFVAMARAFRGGVHRFADVLDLIEARIVERIRGDGSLAGLPMRSAIAASTLLHFGRQSPVIDGAIAFLVDTQRGDGSWPSEPLYYGGRGRLSHWSSPALSTALAIEALALYERRHA